jgi:hypothetical protein
MSRAAFSVATKRLVIRRQDGACCVCGVLVVDTLDNSPRADHEYHHRLPRRAGGRYGVMADVCASPANCLLLCRGHHAMVESNRENALAYGWLLTEGEAPTAVPVFHLGEWVVLDDRGNARPSKSPLPPEGRAA